MVESANRTTYLAIAGLIIVLYGALLSTANSIVQVLSHRRDRVNVIVRARTNMAPRGSVVQAIYFVASPHNEE